MKGHPMSIWQAMWGFDGRISRKYYWLATLILTIGHAIIFFPLLHWLVGGWWLDKRPHELLEAEKIFNMASLISFVLLLYPFLTISVKRLHDLNLSGWWCLPGFAPNFILLAPLIGLGGWQSPTPTLLFQVLAWGTAAVRLVWLIVLGFIRGTAGQNSYGPKG